MKVEKMVKKGWVVLAAVVLTASSALAANIETMGIGVMNTGQAGAVSAYCDNVFAAYYNPAGLTLIEKPTLTAGSMVYHAQIKVYDWNVTGYPTDPAYGGAFENGNVAKGPLDFDSDEMVVASPSLGFAMPMTDKISLGVAVYTPYGLRVTWDKDPANSPSSAYAWESYYGRVAFTPTLAYKVSDKFSVGVGVSLGRSVSEAGKTVEFSDGAKAGLVSIAKQADASEEDKKNAFGAMMFDGAQMKLEATDDFNYSFNVGLMYRPIEQLSFGLTYRGRTETDFEGDVMVKNATAINPANLQPISGQGGLNLDGSVKMEFDHPEQVQAGVRWFANEKLEIEADVTWTGWSVNKRQDENITLLVGGKEMFQTFKHDRYWEDTTAYRLGASYQATEAFSFRAGYTYDPSPVPDETFEFGWPDTDRNVYALGMGWKINDRWMMDAVLQHIISTEKRPTTGGSTELNTNYKGVYGPGAKVSCKDEGILWGAGVSLTYSF
ncbi:outer membrane protein transport protein [Desulfoluna sp.]|uniref:OmpP1/FadL family transporter n=1 Tax=Desulfoluna sp. TaxID=2045199 RepID=UPI002635237A|nr:outer membrane protein transport protein [Desulfoluna sp.]